MKLNAEEALTERKPARQIPVDNFLAQRIQCAVFPGVVEPLATDDDPSNKDLIMEVQVKFLTGPGDDSGLGLLPGAVSLCALAFFC